MNKQKIIASLNCVVARMHGVNLKRQPLTSLFDDVNLIDFDTSLLLIGVTQMRDVVKQMNADC